MQKPQYECSFRTQSNSLLRSTLSPKPDLALLCQEKDKLSWDKKECELLKNFVTAFLEDEDSSSLQEKLLHSPVTFLTSHGTLPQRAPIREGLESAPTPTSETESDSKCQQSPSDVASSTPTQVNDTPLLLLCERSPAKLILLPPTPSCSGIQLKPTPKRLKRIRRKTLCFTPRKQSQKMRSLIELRQQAQETMENLAVENQEFKNSIITMLEDSKNALKHELRMITKTHSHSLCEKIEELECKVSLQDQRIDRLNREVQSLKSQLTEVRIQIKSKSSTQQTEDSGTQHESVASETVPAGQSYSPKPKSCGQAPTSTDETLYPRKMFQEFLQVSTQTFPYHLS